MRRSRCALVASAVLAMSGPALAQASFQVAELPMPAPGVSAAARAINASGHVAGEITDSGGNLHPVTWVGGVTTVLPIPSGYPGAGARGISDTGIVCGNAWSNGSFGVSAAVRWADGQPAYLPTLGGQNSAASGISAGGVITGWTSMFDSFNGQRAYRYSAALENAGLVPANGCSWTIGNAINAHGVLAGTAITATGFSRPYLDDPTEGKIDLGTLGGLTGEALAISSARDVAGWSQTGFRDSSTFDGIVQHAFLWRAGRLTDLGTLPGLHESRALGVNAAGTVVGRCTSTAPGSQPTAFIWRDGQMRALDDAIPAGSGWVLLIAHAINDAGQIAGAGLLNGQRRAFLLTPNP